MDLSLFDPQPSSRPGTGDLSAFSTSSASFFSARTPTASMHELRSLTPSTPTTSNGFGTAMDSANITFSLPPGSGAPHMICIAQANEDLLLRSGNVAYTLLKQQVALLSRQMDTLKVENSTQKHLYEQIIDRIPQLIGMSAHPDGNAQAAPLNDAGATHQPVSEAFRNPPVLGLGWKYPEPRTKPPGVTFTYWLATDYKERAKTGGKPGPHDERINVGQRFIEDDEGNVVSGTVAKEIREILRSVLHSLAWSGQAAALQDALTHEARVYIHGVLSSRFPFLLLCDGGTWKINELIKQMYHGFKGSQIKRSKATALVKAEITDGSEPLSAPTGSKKRERQGSLLSIDGAANPAKSARLSAPPTHDVIPQLSQPSVPPPPTLSTPYTGPSVSTGTSPGATPAPTVALPQAPTPTPASALHFTITTPCPDDDAYTGIGSGGSESAVPTSSLVPVPEQRGHTAAPVNPETSTAIGPAPEPSASHAAGGSSRTATTTVTPSARAEPILNGNASPICVHPTASMSGSADPSTSMTGSGNPSTSISDSGDPSSTTGLATAAVGGTISAMGHESDRAIVPVRKPFGSTSRTPRRSSRLTAADSSSADVALTPSLNTSPLPGTSGDLPIPPPGSVQAQLDDGLTGSSGTTASSKERARINKGGAVKAATRYKPDVISDKNLFIRRMSELDPDVLYMDVLKAFENLTADELEQLKQECAQERRQRKASRVIS